MGALRPCQAAGCSLRREGWLLRRWTYLSPRLRALHRYRRHKTISPARYGCDIVRCLGVVVQRFPHFADSHPKAIVELHERVFRPQPLPHFLPGNDLAGSLHQHEQQPVRKILESHPDSVTRKSAFLRVQLEGTEAVASHVCRHSCHVLTKTQTP